VYLPLIFAYSVMRPGNVWNVVLENDREDHLDWSCEKWSITYSQGAQEYPTWNK